MVKIEIKVSVNSIYVKYEIRPSMTIFVNCIIYIHFPLFVGYSCNSNALTVEDGVCICGGVLVNGFVEDTESFINS